MNDRIEQEVNNTLECLGGDFQMQVSSEFSNNLSIRISGIRVSKVAGFRSRTFYSAVIVLIVIMNIAIGLASFSRQDATEDKSGRLSTIASEYGMTEINF